MFDVCAGRALLLEPDRARGDRLPAAGRSPTASSSRPSCESCTTLARGARRRTEVRAVGSGSDSPRRMLSSVGADAGVAPRLSQAPARRWPRSRRRELHARRGSRGSSRCSARSSTTTYLETGRAPSQGSSSSRRGVLMSAAARQGQQGHGYTVLRRPRAELEERLLGGISDRSGYSFTIPDRDDRRLQRTRRRSKTGASTSSPTHSASRPITSTASSSCSGPSSPSTSAA